MKPNFDLNDPKVKQLIQICYKQTEKALNTSRNVENAVLPIYFTLNSIPEQIGSGVVVCIQTEYFIFSASHVFDCSER